MNETILLAIEIGLAFMMLAVVLLYKPKSRNR